ncbi:MAG: hypothetical protein AAGH88_16260 [Planctomycetota bacterium]
MKLPAPLTAFAILLLAHPALAQDPPAAPADPPNRIDFTPNPRYTVFDGPLREDGTIDYVAAVNEQLRATVKPEDNAYRAMFLLMRRPGEDAFFMGQSAYDAVKAKLQFLDEELEQSPQIVSWYEYAADKGFGEEDRYEIESHAYDMDYTHAGSDVFVQWLADQQAALERLAEAVRLPSYWAPVIENPHESAAGAFRGTHGLGDMRRFARTLEHRIFWSITHGQQDQVVRDFETVFLLAERISRGVTLVESLVAISIEALAIDTLHQVLMQGKLDPAHTAVVLSSWVDRDALRSPSESIRFGERVYMLDALLAIAVGRVDQVTIFGLQEVDASELDAAIRDIGVNLDDGIERLSRHVTVQAATLVAPTYSAYQRIQGLRKVEHLDRFKNLEEKHFIEDQDGNELLDINTALMDREALTELFVDLLYARVAAANVAAGRTWFQFQSRLAVAQASLACVTYQLEHGRYPGSLNDLVPNYLSQAPTDPMDGESLRYRVEADGTAVVYSIFTNLQDDGGTADMDDWSAVKDGDYVWRLTPPEAE